jgi:hypothetical protein
MSLLLSSMVAIVPRLALLLARRAERASMMGIRH